MTTHESELARLLRKIDLEAQAAWNGLYGFTQGSSKHAYITARLERLGQYHQQLQTLVGEQQATRTLMQALEQTEGKASE
ncbi:MAG TPA: hypothetical protein VFA41_00570 [Ktedonobacteraceae bacterium]|jgi:hypothetical protein|nr:hypothetical protein [Ktedonobacteraceae bacterium]